MTSRIAANPAAVVLNGPEVPLLANARTFFATEANHSRSSLNAQLIPTCGRNGSSVSIVPVLTSADDRLRFVLLITERKPKLSRTASLSDQWSWRWNTTVSVSKSYSQCVSIGLVWKSSNERVGASNGRLAVEAARLVEVVGLVPEPAVHLVVAGRPRERRHQTFAFEVVFRGADR